MVISAINTKEGNSKVHLLPARYVALDTLMKGKGGLDCNFLNMAKIINLRINMASVKVKKLGAVHK